VTERPRRKATSCVVRNTYSVYMLVNSAVHARLSQHLLVTPGHLPRQGVMHSLLHSLILSHSFPSLPVNPQRRAASSLEVRSQVWLSSLISYPKEMSCALSPFLKK